MRTALHSPPSACDQSTMVRSAATATSRFSVRKNG